MLISAKYSRRLLMKAKNIVCLFVLLMLATACSPALSPAAEVSISVPTPSISNMGSVPTQPPPPTATPLPTVFMDASTAAIFDPDNSGSLCPKRSPELELGGAPPIIGEIDDTWRCEGYWSFTLPELPDNFQINSATFTPGSCSHVGNPFAFGPMSFGQRAVGSLDIADYGGMLNGLASHEACPESLDVTSFVRGGYKSGSVQFVASFENSDYGNGTGDYLSYRGVEPTLVIEYSYPQ